jgi:hypothetical protein
MKMKNYMINNKIHNKIHKNKKVLNQSVKKTDLTHPIII